MLCLKQSQEGNQNNTEYLSKKHVKKQNKKKRWRREERDGDGDGDGYRDRDRDRDGGVSLLCIFLRKL